MANEVSVSTTDKDAAIEALKLIIFQLGEEGLFEREDVERLRDIFNEMKVKDD